MYVATAFMVPDILTKPLMGYKFKRMLWRLLGHDPEENGWVEEVGPTSDGGGAAAGPASAAGGAGGAGGGAA